VLAILGASISVYFSINRAVLYSASSIVFVSSSPGEDIEDTNTKHSYIKSRIPQYLANANSLIGSKELMDSYNLDISDTSVTVSMDELAMLLRISVNSLDPLKAEKVASEFSNILSQQISKSEISSNQAEPIVSATTSGESSVSAVPIKTNLLRDAILGGFYGLIFAFGIIALRELLDNRVKDARDLKQITSSPVIGIIPIYPDSRDKNLKMIETPEGPDSGPFRALRANFDALDLSRQSFFVFTSSSGDAEISNLTLELSLAMSESGKKILVVDCDLRSPTIHEFLNHDFKKGLTNVLNGQIKVDEAIQPFLGHSLFLLASGDIPANPNELISSPIFKKQILEISTAFDFVFCIAPPILSSTDAAILSSYSSGVILVVTEKESSKDNIRSSVKMLQRVNANLIALVLRVPRTRKKNAYFLSYGNYKFDT
jgi:capsular exopolysaccharide synthesis family protein